MKDKNFDLIISITVFYVISNLFILVFAYLLYLKFSLNGESFIHITLFLLSISSFIGFFIAKFTLKPYFDRNVFLDKLIKDTLHELNIPTATILANVSLLKRGEKDEKRVARLDRIRLSSDKLKKLYQELDYFIRFEINELKRDRFNLKTLILDELEHFKDLLTNIRIETDLRDIEVLANRGGFAKMIDNLISNAIKYNRCNGFIKISLQNSIFTIEDSGVGLEDGEIFKIFDRYYQSDNNSSGYGIGLNIVKSFCDEHKLKIKIESVKGVGTKFIFDIDAILL